MSEKKKRQNIITVVIILAMLLVAGGVILAAKGLPKIEFDPGYEARQEEREATQTTILGEWVDPDNPNFVIDVWRDGKGGFHAIVNLTENDGQVTFWEMDGVWQDFEQGFFYSAGKKSLAVYDVDGNVAETVYYTDGSGSISAAEDGIVWKDEKEKAGNGITFVYSGEY